MNYGWGGMGFDGTGMLVFWLLLIAIVAIGLRWVVPGRTPRAGSEDTPLEILKRRYARGEIDQDEFERAKRTLKD
ncbi:MAG TPA: SHOCT domain-containing protein [Burkholderiales bacterium]|nr:SHOCT domain-containing protein [Burkholderiales bacterium]